MIDIDINEAMLKKKLLKLKIHKSKGPDGIYPRVLKELASVICEPLGIIFKTSIRSGTPPDDYRPVSLTSVVCKVL